MSTGVQQFIARDPDTIRDSILRVLRNGLIDRGVASPNVTPGSDWYVFAQAVALQCAVVEANCVIKADALMPDTAVDVELGRWASNLGLSKQAAAGSTGTVNITTSAITTIATGSQLYDESGLQFEVSLGGAFSDGDPVSIDALTTGVGTNHAAGDVLRWVNTPPFADEKVIVAAGGLVNGVDAETDEDLRGRVLASLQNPPVSGNWEHTNEFAEASTPRVQKSFCYPAIAGPASFHIAVTAAPTATNKSRVVDTPTTNGIVFPFVIGKMPTHPDGVVTTITDSPVDVAIGLSLPEASTANPPGLGGGWKDGTPWPAPDGVSFFVASVTSKTNDSQFIVNEQTVPIEGTSHIAWLSPTTFTLYQAVVAKVVSGSAGAWEILIDNPFVGIGVGDLVWPDSENAQAYCDALIAAFAAMGPGEKTANASAIIRGFRHPPPNVSWPYSMGPTQLRAIFDVGEEVEDTQYFYRFGNGTINGSSGVMKPAVPSVVTSPPNQFIPRRIAFYRLQ